MLDVYKKDLKGRKQIEETIMAKFGLKAAWLTTDMSRLGAATEKDQFDPISVIW